MNDQDHSLSLSDPDRSLVLSHLLVNFLKNLVWCQTSFRFSNTIPKTTTDGVTHRLKTHFRPKNSAKALAGLNK
jgi:hypothetical protein